MKQTPEISIITVNYNGFNDTCDLLDSVQEHLHTRTYEIIVVDNGSRKNEAAMLRQRYPHAIVLRSEQNLGFAGGNNLGIAQAQGKYIFLLNNDTYIKDDSLSALCDTLENNPDIGAVSPKIRFAFPPYAIQYGGFTPMTRYTLRNHATGYDEPDKGQYDIPGPTAFLHGAALMFKKEILEEIGNMSEIFFLYYEEMDWCSRLTRQGYRLWYQPACTVYHKESRSTGNDSPLKTYYLNRNRLLYSWRNCPGAEKWIALFYQLTIAIPKNIMLNLLKGRTRQAKAICKGCMDFFSLKNKKK